MSYEMKRVDKATLDNVYKIWLGIKNLFQTYEDVNDQELSIDEIRELLDEDNNN